MAFIQRNLPPPVKTLNFTIKDFTGGLNNVTSDTLLKDNESPDMLNMTINEEGTMEKRKGSQVLDGFDYKNPITLIDKFRTLGGIEHLVVATATEMFIDKIKICDVYGDVSGVTYLNNYYFVDGHIIRVYGKFPQADDGAHIKVIGTPINDYVLMTITNPRFNTPLDTTYTTGRFCYSYEPNEFGNMEAWYEPCKQELDDTFKGTNLLPENPTIITMHGDRLFIGGDKKNPGNIYITDIMNVFYTPVGMPIQLPPNGLEVTGMRVFMDSVVVGRRDDLHVIYGITNRTSSDRLFTLSKINCHTGFINNKCISEAHNYLMFLGSDGVVYKMHTTNTNMNVLATTELSKPLDLFKYPISLDLYELKKCSSIFIKDKFYIFHKDITLVYFYKFMAWSIYKGIPANCGVNSNGELLIGGADNYIHQSIDDYHDNGIPIMAYRASKMYDFDMPSNYKQFKELFIIGHVYDDYVSDIKIRYEIDYVDIFQIATIVNKMGRWGVAKWGDRFITRNICPSLPITIGRRGRKIRFIFSNGEAVTEKFSSYTDMVNMVHPVHMNLYQVKESPIVQSPSTFYRYALGEYTVVPQIDLYQPMKIYELNGEFSVKGKR
jgi:hypothetical protein